VISEAQLEQLSGWLSGNADSPDREQEMRSAFPDLHFTFCSDDDVMSEQPASKLPGFNLYLVDSSNHCLCLTSDSNAATGLVVAEVEDE